MLEQGFFAFVLVGISYAAYLDLKTSEVPDRVPLAVAGISLLYYGYQSVLSGSPDPIIASLVSGTALFLLGWTMYMAGMWGGADAFILGAVGYALPALPAAFTPSYTAPWPAPFSLVLTVFLVGAVYSVFYAAYIAVKAEGFRGKLAAELGERRQRYAAIVVLYTLVVGATTLAVYTVFNPSPVLVARNFTASLLLLAALLGLTVFLRTVESRVMKTEIPVEELEEGDVLAEDIELQEARVDPAENVTDRIVDLFRSTMPFTLPGMVAGHSERIAGLTSDQVEEIQERHERVKVRTGVRFIPAFPAALLILLAFGDPLYFLLLQTL